MQITDLILKEFKPLEGTETAAHGFKLSNEFKLSHIPIFEESIFIGNISELALEENSESSSIIELKDLFEYFYLTDTSTIFDAINEFYIHSTNILPVLNDDKVYLGYLLIEDVLAILSKFPLISEPAAMIKVKIPTKKYSLSEVAKIVESNNAQLFGAFISAFNNDATEVIVKFNAENVTSVGETFERFGYEIVEKYYNDDKKTLINERFDHLMNFLDI